MAGKKGGAKSRPKSGTTTSKKRKKKAKALAPSPQFPRLGWSRSPVQKPHSTKKGARGYDRKRAKKQTRREAEESSRS